MFTRLLGAVLGLASFAGSAEASTVLFENAFNGAVGGTYGLSNPDVLYAENFTLGSSSIIQTLSFNAYWYNPDYTIPYSITWSINYDTSNQVGAVLASGAVASGATGLTREFVTTDGFTADLSDFIIDIPDLLLDTGSYWVIFHAFNVGLVWTLNCSGNCLPSDGDHLSLFSTDGGSSWQSEEYNNVFQILGTAAIPLPAAFPLFATALAGMGLLGWRRKRKASASV